VYVVHFRMTRAAIQDGIMPTYMAVKYMYNVICRSIHLNMSPSRQKQWPGRNRLLFR